MTIVEQIEHLLSQCTEEQRREVFKFLRAQFPIHALEGEWNTTAEIILDAIARSSDLTQRGLRGVIAEAAFKYNVIARLTGWTSEELEGDHPYDFLLRDDVGQVRVQVKMQRLKNHIPMTASQGYRFLPADMFVVETQRTRGGTDPQTHKDTRPYRFGQFDILAVSMHPSTGNWSAFMCTVADWLLERAEDPNLILKFQPVPRSANDAWTDQFIAAVDWFRSGARKKILSLAARKKLR